MIHAYNEAYLSKAQISLAQMLRYAVTDLHYQIDHFFSFFIRSEICSAFENGDSHYTVGLSGIELAKEVLYSINGDVPQKAPTWSSEKSPEYWCGWSLGYYQWYTAHTFQDICSYIRPSDVVAMYNPYHEMDILQFVDALNRIIPPVDTTTNLARLRQKAGFSQRMLAYSSGISVRMIQNYEQRRKDINKAQADTVLKLGTALGCDMKALLETDGARPLGGTGDGCPRLT